MASKPMVSPSLFGHGPVQCLLWAPFSLPMSLLASALIKLASKAVVLRPITLWSPLQSLGEPKSARIPVVRQRAKPNAKYLWLAGTKDSHEKRRQEGGTRKPERGQMAAIYGVPLKGSQEAPGLLGVPCSKVYISMQLLLMCFWNNVDIKSVQERIFFN